MSIDQATALLRGLEWFFIFALGASFGSFGTVLEARVPDGLSVVSPPSACPHCGHQLRWFENVPILGYLALRGKCGGCKQPISRKYPLTELCTAFLFVLSFTPGPDPQAGIGNFALAAMPVMEGKAALFKRFADIDAFPICLDTQDADEIVRTVKAIAPGFAGINLEDISAPRCFEIEARLRAELDIPVFHDDQHGTAIVCVAALRNALKVVGKEIEDVTLVMSGAGAAGTAVLKLLMAAGLKHAVVADQRGVVYAGREDIEAGTSLEWIADNTNEKGLTGTLKQAIRGADVFIGVSAANILDANDIAAMAPGSIVFALANPNPEIEPSEAAKFASVVATGRSDFPNQINNVLAFPGFFRGLLDAGAHKITEKMLLAAANALANCVESSELNASYIVPSVFHPDVASKVADAVRKAARK